MISCYFSARLPPFGKRRGWGAGGAGTPRLPVLAEKTELLSQAQLLDDRAVTLDVLLGQVVEKVLSVANHLLKTSLGMEILGVLLQMLGEVVDALGEDRDLHLGRAGVALIDLIGLNEVLLGFFLHGFSPSLYFSPVAQ